MFVFLSPTAKKFNVIITQECGEESNQKDLTQMSIDNLKRGV